MIQLNLLPDIKLKSIKAERQKRIITSVSIVAVIASGALLCILAITAFAWQPKTISDLSRDITDRSASLTDTSQAGNATLDDILTVQNQLKTLPGLHGQKAEMSRQFAILQQVTPQTVRISEMVTDRAANTMNISGSADSILSVNAFVNNLKFTSLSTGEEGGARETRAAFKNVVLLSFGRTEDGASYNITLEFDPAIFDANQNPQLSVAASEPTSVGRRPEDIFQQLNNNGSEQ